jgi:hypothetical protein
MRVQLVAGQCLTQIIPLLIRVGIDVEHLIKCKAQQRPLRATPVLLVEVKAAVVVHYKNAPVEAGGKEPSHGVDAFELDVVAIFVKKTESI